MKKLTFLTMLVASLFFLQVSATALEIVGGTPQNSGTSGPPIIVDNATNFEITATQAKSGNYIFTNTGATGAITASLPDVATNMKVSILLTAAYDIDIDPNGSERILVLTNANGDKISSDATVGSGITLVGINSTQWLSTGRIGAWADAD
jgi:hypothetical protein